MPKYRYLSCILVSALTVQGTYAQTVPRRTVVEHFTNTHCSTCASRNPGFYGNLQTFPEVLHIAYYPSAPYPACPFNQINKVENDARTNYYSIYGSTPRIVVNGEVISNNTVYTDPSIFQNSAGKTSDYSINVQVRQSSSTMGEASITIKKLVNNSIGGLNVYAVVTEDTVRFDARNGEGIHYDVFHKSLTGIAPMSIADPMIAGDSLKLTFSFDIGSGWGRSSVTALLQDGASKVLQAARASFTPGQAAVPAGPCAAALCMYPIPAKDELRFSYLPAGYHKYVIVNSVGQVILQGVAYDTGVPISLRTLSPGIYFIALDEGGLLQRGTFVKQ